MCCAVLCMLTALRLICPRCLPGIQFDQDDLAVRLGDIQLMQAGQPLPFDAKAANKYLKETCAVHGTVNIYVSVGKGPGSGELLGLVV